VSELARPPGPSGRPLVGNLIELVSDPLEFLTRCAHEYGDIARYRVVQVTSFLLNHPDYIKYVLVDNRRNFVKGRVLRANRLLLGNGLTTSEGDFWLQQRRLVQPAFHHQRVEAYGRIMVDYAERLIANWRNDDVCDIHLEMNRLAQEIAAKTLFDADIADEAEEISHAFKICLEQFQRRSRTAFLIPTTFPTPDNLRLRRAVQSLDEIIYRMIRERRARPDDCGDLLSILLQANAADGGSMSDRQLRDEVMTLFLAGHDPIGAALAWTWYLLAQHPLVEEKLTAELSAALAGRAPSVEDLPQLRYTEMVMKEVLRLYPPVWSLVRTAVQDCEIGGYRVRAGNSVALSQWVMHRDARYFDSPHEFKPERWAAENIRSLPKFAYFPFGGGPRSCVGESFAMMELCLIVAMIASRFHFTLVSEQAVELLPSIILHPKEEIRVQLKHRSLA